MIDVYIGVLGEEHSVLALEFETFAEASKFCDEMAAHYKEEKKRLYMAIDTAREFEEMEEVFKYEDDDCDGELDSKAFGQLLQMCGDCRIHD